RPAAGPTRHKGPNRRGRAAATRGRSRGRRFAHGSGSFGYPLDGGFTCRRGLGAPPRPRSIGKINHKGPRSAPPKKKTQQPLPLAPSFRSAADRLYSERSPCNGAPDGRECAPFRAAQRSAREELGMIGLVLVTHGRLAIEFRSALEHVVGPQ